MRLLLAILLFPLLAPISAYAQTGQYRPQAINPDGPELYAVFITTSTCLGSNREGFEQTVEQAKLLLAARATADELGFAIRGVALDWDVRGGMGYLLDRFGEFDEMAAGRNWFSADAAEHVWRAEGGIPATPQLVIFRRTVSPAPTRIDFSADEVLVRLVGQEIDRFVESGGVFSTE